MGFSMQLQLRPGGRLVRRIAEMLLTLTVLRKGGQVCVRVALRTDRRGGAIVSAFRARPPPIRQRIQSGKHGMLLVFSNDDIPSPETPRLEASERHACGPEAWYQYLSSIGPIRTEVLTAVSEMTPKFALLQDMFHFPIVAMESKHDAPGVAQIANVGNPILACTCPLLVSH